MGYESIRLNYAVNKIEDDKFYHKPTMEELDGGYRDTGYFVALKPGKWNHWNFKENPDVVGDYAHTFMEQEDGEPAFITNGHSSKPLDRIGYLIESTNKDNKVIQRARITHPDAIKLYDAKLLSKRVSIEADSKIDYERSTPDNRIVTSYHGRETAFVQRPACVSCPNTQLEKTFTEELNKILLEKEGEKMVDKQSSDDGKDSVTISKTELKEIIMDTIDEYGIKPTPTDDEDDSDGGLDNTFAELDHESDPVEPEIKLEEALDKIEDENVKEYLKTRLSVEEEDKEKQEMKDKLIALEEKNTLFEEYFEKSQELKDQEHRLTLEEEVTTLASKFDISLEEDYFTEKDDKELEGEIRTYKAMLSKFPQGDLPLTIGGATPTDDTGDETLKSEVAKLEEELGSNRSSHKIIL